MSCTAAYLVCLFAIMSIALGISWLMVRHSAKNSLTALLGLATFLLAPLAMGFALWQVAGIPGVWQGLTSCTGGQKRLINDLFEPAFGPVVTIFFVAPIFFVGFGVATMANWISRRLLDGKK